MDLIADTSLLVGIWRGQAWARSFATEHATKSLGVPWVVLGEFWHGAARAGHDPVKVRDFLMLGIPLLDPEPVIPTYARICAALQDTAAWSKIGQNDLWIAAVSATHGLPLVTRNRRHFDAIEGLEILAVGA